MNFLDVPVSERECDAFLGLSPRFLMAPAPRPFLSKAENDALKQVIGEAYEASKTKLSSRIKEENLCFKDVRDLVTKDVADTVFNDSRLTAFKSDLENPRSVMSCALRDVYRNNLAVDLLLFKVFSASVDINNESRLTMGVRNFFERSSDLLKANLWLSQDDVDRKAAAVAKRFELDGLFIQGASKMTTRQQMRFIEKAEKAMETACKKMGIREDQWGHGYSSSMELVPEQIALMQDFSGQFVPAQKGFTTIRLNMGSASPQRTLVHEFAHLVDNRLANFVIEEHEKRGIPFERSEHERLGTLYFSSMTPEQQAMLPQAKRGLEQISNSLMDGSEEQNLSQALDKLAQRFSIEHLGPESYVTLSKEKLEAYTTSLRQHDDIYLKTFAEQSRLASPKEAMSKATIALMKKIGESYPNQEEGIPMPAFLNIARSIHGDAEMERRSKRSASYADELAAVAIHSHALTASLNPSGGMVMNSIKDDLKRQYNGQPEYLSLPTEILARAVSRPANFQDFRKDIFSGNQGWNIAMSRSQVSQVSKGFGDMLDAAGLQRSHHVQLGHGFEKPMTMATKAAFFDKLLLKAKSEPQATFRP